MFYSLASFFLSSLSFTANANSQDSRAKTDHHHSPLPLQPAHKHSDIYMLLCTWDDYLVCVSLCPSSWMISSVYHESRNLYYRTVQPWHVEGMGQYDFAKFRCRWNFCCPPNWKENDIRRHALANEWIRYNTT